MKCNICGNEVTNNIVFCPYCGSAIKKQEQNTNFQENIMEINNEVLNEPSINQGLNTNQNIDINTNLNTGEVLDSEVNEPVLSEVEPTYNEVSNNIESPTTNESYAANQNPYNIDNGQNYVQTNYNVNTIQQEQIQDTSADKVSVGLAILSWFIPLAGIILFFTKKKTSPKTSKVCGIVALIAIVLSSVVLIFTGLFVKNIFNDILNVNEEEYEYITESNTKKEIWEEYKVIINNKELELPCSYDEYVKITNFKMKEEKENLTIKSYYYDIVNVYTNDKLAGMINIYNMTGSDSLYKDANVSRISQSSYHVNTNKASKIIFPGDLYVGKQATKEDIINLLGTPLKESETEYNGIITYRLKYSKENEYTTSNYYEIVIIDNSINELVLDNRP